MHPTLHTLHTTSQYPIYIPTQQTDTYDKRMAYTWKADDRFRMFFGMTKTTHNKLTCTGRGVLFGSGDFRVVLCMFPCALLSTHC